MKHWLRHEHFIRLNEGKIVLWDFENHRQFEIELDELARLVSYSLGSQGNGDELETKLKELDLLVDKRPDPKWGWDWLSEIFHIGTNYPDPPMYGRNSEQDAEDAARSYIEFCEELIPTAPVLVQIRGGERVQLPPPDLRQLQGASLWDTLASRRTCRDFVRDPISLQTVSNLLYAAFAAIDRDEADEPIGALRFGFRRTSPSAGGLQCTEPYVWVQSVEGLTPGIYHYLSVEHALEIVRPALPDEPIATYLCNQHWANDLLRCPQLS